MSRIRRGAPLLLALWVWLVLAAVSAVIRFRGVYENLLGLSWLLGLLGLLVYGIVRIHRVWGTVTKPWLMALALILAWAFAQMLAWVFVLNFSGCFEDCSALTLQYRLVGWVFLSPCLTTLALLEVIVPRPVPPGESR